MSVHPRTFILPLLLALSLALFGLRPPATDAAGTFTLYAPLVTRRPDTGRIAFISYPCTGCLSVLSVMQPDGSGRINLASNAEFHPPAWSPDGTQIAFGYYQTSPITESALYRMDVASATRTKVLDLTHPPLNVSWSPDGQWLVFDSLSDIFVVRVDGTGLTQLTANTGRNESPDWSPDGTQIVFSSNRLGSAGIYLMNADGSAQHLIGPSGSDDTAPQWSPDGAQIAFTRFLTGTSQIYVMQANGAGEQLVVSLSNIIVNSPTWSPDGESLAFVGAFLRFFSIYRIGVDGSGLTSIASGGSSPNWSP